MFDRSHAQEQFLEFVLILISLGLCFLFYRMGSHRMVVLNLFYLPVVLAAFFLGRYRAGILAVLSAVCAAAVMAVDLSGFAAFSSPVMIGLALTIWAAVLALTTLLTGTLSDERLVKTRELHDAYVGVVEVLSQYLNNAETAVKDQSAANARLAERIAVQMKLSDREIDDIRIATLLQDMESIEVTTKVIQKAIGSLAQTTAAQYTFHGGDLAQSLGQVLRGALPLLVEHDRCFDGSHSEKDVSRDGEIPIGVHIIRTARCYASLVDEHTGNITPSEAIDMLRKDSEETHLPAVLNALEHIVLGTDDLGPEPKDSNPELAGITD